MPSSCSSSLQVIEVARRQAKVRESSGNVDNLSKFEAAQARLQELKSNMTVLGKEAVATMSAVEAQQQRLTLQRLISMVISYSIMQCFCFFKFLRN